MINSLKGLLYDERLVSLKLTTLETRRLRGDLIKVFKILKDVDSVDCSKFLKLSETNLTGHHLKLFKLRFNTNIGKFCNRVIDEWNMLPQILCLVTLC